MSDASSVLRLLPSLPSLPPFAAWVVDAGGTFLRFTGPAAERARLELGGLFVGRDYREAFPADSAVRRLLARALEGRTVAERVSWQGLEWFTLAEPLYDDTGLVAVEGISLLLPATVETAGEGAADVEVYDVVAPARGLGVVLKPGDVWCEDEEECSSTRFHPASLGPLIRRRHPDAFRRAHGPGDAPSSPSRAGAFPRPRLVE